MNECKDEILGMCHEFSGAIGAEVVATKAWPLGLCWQAVDKIARHVRCVWS